VSILLAVLLVLLPLIDSGESSARSVIDKLVSAECDEMIFVMQPNGEPARDEDGATIMKWPGAFCGWQMTEIGVENGWSGRARVQISIGCDGVTDLSKSQETEYWYRVNIEDGTLLAKDHVEISPHLIRSGTWVPEFFDPKCFEDDTSGQPPLI
jgi:hypothetical protein